MADSLAEPSLLPSPPDCSLLADDIDNFRLLFLSKVSESFFKEAVLFDADKTRAVDDIFLDTLLCSTLISSAS